MTLGLTIAPKGGWDLLSLGAFFGMMDTVVKCFPSVKAVATALREVQTTNHHSWSAVAWVNGQKLHAPTADLNVYDREGGGYGFASGFIYGLLSGASALEALKLGWAHGALLTALPEARR